MSKSNRVFIKVETFSDIIEQQTEVYNSQTFLQVKQEFEAFEELATCEKYGASTKTTQDNNSKPLQKAESLKCDHCDKIFDTKRYKERHMKQQHGDNKPYICDICGKAMTTNGGLRQHKMTHDGGKPLECEICGKNFLRTSTLRMHVYTHTGEKPHSCTVCNQAFAQAGPWKKHMKAVHYVAKPFVCLVCLEAFGNKNEFKNHVKSNHQEEYSDYIFVKEEISFHLEQDETEINKSEKLPLVKKLVCVTCKNVFDTFEEFRAHFINCQEAYRLSMQAVAQLTQDSLNIQQAIELEKTDPGSLIIHKRIFHEDYIFKCGKCNETCGSKEALKAHSCSKYSPVQQHLMEKHDPREKLKCNCCEKSFQNEQNKKRHMKRQHGDATPHICDICGTATNTIANLRLHKLEHEGKEPLECVYCGKKVATSHSLRLHLYTHTGEKPYRCSICSVGFTYITYWKCHMKDVHAVTKPYFCELCGEEFDKFKVLKHHEKTEHAEEMFT